MIGWSTLAAAAVVQTVVVPPAPPPAPPVVRTPPAAIVSTRPGIGEVEVGGVKQEVRFEVDPRGDAALVFRTLNGFRTGGIAIADYGTALALLTDRQFAFATPALLDWAGADLVKLRDRRISEAEAALKTAADRAPPRSTIESAVRPDLAARMRLSSALSLAGRVDEALAVMTAAGPRDPVGKQWQRMEYSAIATRLANIEHAAGRSDAAIARLRAARGAMKPDDKYALNLDSNLAAMLVEHGQAAEALALVEATRAALPRDAIAGSDRHFAWIRACALKQLGRDAEAATERPRFLGVGQPYDGQFITADSGDVARRGLACLGDVSGMARLLAGQAASGRFAPLATLWVQPGFRQGAIDPAFIAAVAREPVLRDAIAGRVVMLGPEFSPALRGWRTP